MNPPNCLVFLVDDDPSVRKGIKPLLLSADHCVAAFASATDFLVRAPHDGPACLVLDIRMPELSGLDAATMIRRRERYTGESLHIIALTAHAMEGDRERCLAAGMNAYLSKPLTLLELKASLDAVVARKAARPDATASADDRAVS